MKVDGLGVILAIILLPIILVVTYYIQLQVDTIARENSYNTKLLDATYDAMSAFELNTANEELSSVADSMRSIVLASNNTLFNTLATNLGMSNASQGELRPYVPAILYTMYDGYYIYSPAETAVVGERTEKDPISGLTTTKGYLAVGDIGVTAKGNQRYSYDSSETTVTNKPYDDSDSTSVYGAVLYKDKNNEGEYTTDKKNAVKETDYILKPYTQYSARYVKGDIDVTINYTLDNYLNIEGTIGGVYYTKSGYLIRKGLVTEINGDSNVGNFNENDIKNKILGVKTNADETTIHAQENDASVKVNGQTIKAEWGNFKFDNSDSIKTISEVEERQKKGELNNDQIYELQKYKAIAYYVSSAVFSNWVYENLGELQYKDIKDIKDSNKMIGNQLTSGTKDFYYDFTGNTTKIFDDSEDPEATDSNFNTHRIEVIKNSIKYNLNQSISAYCNMKGSNDFSMPVLDDIEWDNILSRISIVSFMQGWDCGLDVYNNYQIAYSTNNELTVVPNEIYYVPKGNFNNETANYHRIDCPELADSADGYIAFKSNDIKYDRLADKTGTYRYDHKNLACYTCINNNNYESQFFTKYNSENTPGYNADSYYDRINNIKANAHSSTVLTNKQIAGYIGLGAMRQSTYKTNALEVSEGYEVKDVYKTIQNSYTYPDSIPSNVKQVQLTFSGGVIVGNSTYANKIDLKFNDNDSMIEKISLSTTETKTIDNPGTSIKIEVIQPDSGTAYVNLIGIKYIYK